ncbi:MAG: hypothetical protein HYX60_09045 [Legionella longbeachae]|nr:hypothetical protein [Legionella longbeachae]
MINPVNSLGHPTGFAITKEGFIGLTPGSDQYIDSFNPAGISSMPEQGPYFTKKNISYNNKDTANDIYIREKDILVEWINCLPDNDKQKLNTAVQKIDALSKNNLEDATKALIYTRHYLYQDLSSETKQEKSNEYIAKMNDLGKASWGTIAVSVVAAVTGLGLILTAYNIYQHFKIKSELKSIIDETTPESNLGPSGDNKI